jgi:hypothetical protein
MRFFYVIMKIGTGYKLYFLVLNIGVIIFEHGTIGPSLIRRMYDSSQPLSNIGFHESIASFDKSHLVPLFQLDDNGIFASFFSVTGQDKIDSLCRLRYIVLDGNPGVIRYVRIV